MDKQLQATRTPAIVTLVNALGGPHRTHKLINELVAKSGMRVKPVFHQEVSKWRRRGFPAPVWVYWLGLLEGHNVTVQELLYDVALARLEAQQEPVQEPVQEPLQEAA